ncbi:efflux RND transporter permease subunit [Chryseolinea soli]|uniref:Efflux RND transporter permease subunit n=1 Tax=Chryseolinea soli TaxID=2321403 RepID=A0A385ST19_9BACT|nr:efflux RND transporter permease subunit [Chryseolinea soli]AYB31948.1 efflux RND transporter permease subunit [Chryseolinea soli]
MNFIEAALKYKQVTLAVLFMLFAIGVNSLLDMPRREDPKITIRQGLVIAFFPGANSSQVEDQVTKKLEQYLFQYEEVDKTKTTSTSKDGMTVITVELTANVKQPDIFWSKLRHQLLIARAVDLPEGVNGPIVDSDFGDTEAMVIALDSKDASFEQLKYYAQKLEDLIRTLPAASKIKRIGDQREQIVASANSQKLSQYGVRLDQVVDLLKSQNSISATGEVKTHTSTTPLYTTGFFHTENDLSSQVVGTSSTGAIVRLGDVANMKRDYAEPDEIIAVNGNKAIMLSIQMHEGNNIVDFGKAVEQKIDEANRLMPTNIKLTTLVSQPTLVDHNISHFIKEFFLAIVSVIVVVLLLLPFRIASVAAMAIPMTVALTFAIMNAVGIELHQVSLAALILVLGMVVDDAIVIADNYVELLDEQVDRWTAAWRSAHDLLMPVLVATITIIASFLPMVLISGATGEFIATLPITVAIALIASYFVALFLTPLLCYTFIKKGLHTHAQGHETNGAKQKKSVLTYMQDGYNVALDWCVNHPKITVIGSFSSLLLVGLLLKFGIRELFFPPAERNQFIVELWMPTETKLEKTNETILKAQKIIQGDDRVLSYATFTGTSAPRFYYNFTPEFPTKNYALILVNTTSEATAEQLSHELSTKVRNLTAGGTFFVKLMQQGSSMSAPVEVRIVGEDVNRLKEIRDQVREILKTTPGSLFVRDDFSEDYYGIDLQLKEEAKRLGFTTSSVAQSVYTGFNGAPISTMYEGDTPIDIVLRLDANKRRNTTDLQDIYITSPATGAELPLRQIATLIPQWHSGKIMHRNGVRTLTVQSETQPDVLPAELLEAIKPKIQKLTLPEGYRIDYGGEEANKDEVFVEMVTALVISLVLIFFILLFQFRNMKETIIVMLTIPLSLLGAIFGLVVTGNNFSFTAFIGLIALSGIVVRNAIILVDYTNILLRQGMDIRTSAIESAKRRLRPIFLTAMAAAIGVLPMIISGSGMWAPLASVLAFGVVWSMIMALLTVPVLYIAMIRDRDKNILPTVQ